MGVARTAREKVLPPITLPPASHSWSNDIASSSPTQSGPAQHRRDHGTTLIRATSTSSHKEE